LDAPLIHNPAEPPKIPHKMSINKSGRVIGT